MHTEMARQQVDRSVVLKRPIFVRAPYRAGCATEYGSKHRIVLPLARNHAFGRSIAHKIVPDRDEARALLDPERAGGKVEQGQAEHFTRPTQAGEKVVAFGFKNVFFEDRAGRDDPRDFAADDSVCGRGSSI